MAEARPIIFLDVDGVLNTRSTKCGAEGVRDCTLQPVNNPNVQLTGVVEIAKVAALRRAVETAGARIVVSSSWREAFHTAADFASAIGIAPPLASAPDLFHKDWKTGWKFSSQRFHEIDGWLGDHKRRLYAILDDHECIPQDLALYKNFVKTDADVGLTNADINRVLALLGRADLTFICETTSTDWFAESPVPAPVPPSGDDPLPD